MAESCRHIEIGVTEAIGSLSIGVRIDQWPAENLYLSTVRVAGES